MHMFYNLCAIKVRKNGIEILIIYNIVERGGDGLVMTKSVKIVCYNAKY